MNEIPQEYRMRRYWIEVEGPEESPEYVVRDGWYEITIGYFPTLSQAITLVNLRRAEDKLAEEPGGR